MNYDQFRVTHTCGGSFTIDPKTFIENFEPGNTLRCLNCLVVIDEKLREELWKFFRKYIESIDFLRKGGFDIRLVVSED